MERLENDFAETKASTMFLTELTEGAKPYTGIDGSICVAGPGITQGLMRYFRGENKEHSRDYVACAVDDLCSFLNRLLEYIKWNNVTETLHKVTYATKDHVAACLSGVEALCSTYGEEEQFMSLSRRLSDSISLFDAGCSRYGQAIQGRSTNLQY